MNQTQELFRKIDEICPDGQRNRTSYFQLQYFVVGKEPTIQGKIQSCKREMLSRKEHIQAVMVELEDVTDKKILERIQLDNVATTEGLLPEAKEVIARSHKRKIKALDARIEYCQNEIRAKEDETNFLIGLYEKLIGLEAEKDWDSLEVQAEYWNAKLTREIESRLMMGQLPNVEDFKTVMALPQGMPIKDLTKQLIANKKAEVKRIEDDSDSK